MHIYTLDFQVRVSTTKAGKNRLRTICLDHLGSFDSIAWILKYLIVSLIGLTFKRMILNPYFTQNVVFKQTECHGTANCWFLFQFLLKTEDGLHVKTQHEIVLNYTPRATWWQVKSPCGPVFLGISACCVCNGWTNWTCYCDNDFNVSWRKIVSNFWIRIVWRVNNYTTLSQLVIAWNYGPAI